MDAKITSKGQITVPKAIRDQLQVGPGDALSFELHGKRIEVRAKHRHAIAEFRGLFRVPRARSAKEERNVAWDAMTRRLTKPESP